MTSYVAYARVSTAQQRESDLGLGAQRKAINDFLKPGDTLLGPIFEETESGKLSDRPVLRKAMERCKLTGATLLVAKLDRLSRNVAFLSQLMESKVPFVATDMPEANELMVHIMVSVAEAERKAISKRTKEALAAAKAKGTKLGGFRIASTDEAGRVKKASVKVNSALGTAANTAKAREFNARVRDAIREIEAEGASSLSDIARQLNAAGIPTSRGGSWKATQVARVLQAARLPCAASQRCHGD